MDIAKKYIEGLKEAYNEMGFREGWKRFAATIYGASEDDIDKIKGIFPDCPDSLLDLLRFVDGTYYREYGEERALFYFLGSDVAEHPYYLLSSREICENENNVLEYYSDYIERKYSQDEVKVDERITDCTNPFQWLHFSDCMNNGGTSQLYIDFSPSAKGRKGQVVRYLHDPDELEVIADSFDEYLENLMDNGYDFIDEDAIEDLED